MEKEALQIQIKSVVEKFLDETKDREIQIISHFDTDGITSASIMVQALGKLDKTFSLRIVKNLDKEIISSLPKNKITLFLDLASGSLNHIRGSGLKSVFIIDHHEIPGEVPEKINIINPQLNGKEKISSSGLVYLFCKEIDEKNKELAKLAVLGMVGDMLEKEIDKLNNNILSDGEVAKKRGLLIYPSTRPINKVLESSSQPYIPGVTGDSEGVKELLRESGIVPEGKRYKNLIDLDEQEMTNLVTGIILRNPKAKKEIIGDIFLIKSYNKLEDARELSARINACSRLGESETALKLCLEIPDAKKRAESIHAKYRQSILSSLKFISKMEKIEGKKFVIINAKNKIPDTIIGTMASILSNSPLYEEGTIITTMAYNENDEIKVSSRNSGRTGRNLREVLKSVTEKTGGETGGHEHAAGCLIEIEKEEEFIKTLKKELEMELVKIPSKTSSS